MDSARVEHEIFMSGEVHMRTLFIEQPETPTPLSDCCVLAVTPLLREMILRAIHPRASRAWTTSASACKG